MDVEKIGKFIASLRKEKNLTQEQLAEKMGVTDRAVSKWERGLSLPDASLMIPLCDELGIKVNELLLGDFMKTQNDDKKTQDLIVELSKIREEKDKELLRAEIFIGLFATMIYFICVVFALIFMKTQKTQLWLILGGLVPLLAGVAYALRIEQVAGFYKCKHCDNKFVPTYLQMWLAPHNGRSRYFKCLKCGKRSFHKKVIV